MAATANPKVVEIQQHLETSYSELQQFIQGSLSGLDSTRLYISPGGEEWTIMQSMAHIVEFLPYWAEEIKKLVATPGCTFGRTQQDEGRLHAISEHGDDSLSSAVAALPTSYAHLTDTMKTLKDSDLELTGVHPRYGEKPLGWFIKEFVADHLANHVIQLKSCLKEIS